jgi:hypothetical protein
MGHLIMIPVIDLGKRLASPSVLTGTVSQRGDSQPSHHHRIDNNRDALISNGLNRVSSGHELICRETVKE